MRCPFCSYHDSKVIDSRTRDGGRTIRRRRECLKCQRRFTTREQLDEIPLWVIKTDNRREEFDRQKLVRSLQVACIKRPISMATIEQITSKIEYDLRDRGVEEVESTEIGEAVMMALKELDEIAYLRFASVYRNFQVKEEFIQQLNLLK
ncbi:MAG TPA: transcriptional regulator NrdR [bacterium]|mgnify:CR=1 FL=1|nr:transcriptional regulator NrdR [bacterium]HOC24366.1 transcriptional regulator NrdR [bacterium]HOC89668.1 transcriptional regulator NrdR [bacterium]HOH07610.1 transcriptional regulator NrdR [bacterium]HOY44875.1 transcriptional regulator NrdR [bacterium]